MTTYDYLGLVGDPAVNERAKKAIDVHGVGGHGTAVASASLRLHRELERRLAEFVGHEDAVTFPSGYQTNSTVIPVLAGRGDWVLSDELNHASIIDGCRLAQSRGAHVQRYRHNDVTHLRELLAQAPADRTTLVVSDSVFSADGDLMPLPDIIEACREHGALLYVDEAHGLGVLGRGGRGIHEHFGLTPDPTTLIMSPLSKAVASTGGFVAAPRSLTELLRIAAPGCVFSAALPATAIAAATAALDVIESDEGIRRRDLLRRNIAHFIDRAGAAGLLSAPAQEHHSGVVPVFIGDDQRALRIAANCRDHGVMVVPFVFPAAASGKARLRVNVTARHTPEIVDLAIDVIAAACHDTP
ncbi:aminotransferase class I/II-fold pyridoxal phosphate-dependent enzyme [Streptomyces pinistramenti]|uniref:aminotransferase class I/II-fold pyridoxal phosphate-dependent enzyme n=1 Tax=Streptomyces pinistramenti TaxID=2884812 RepID=UPI002223D164|nr:aminotransferase class I/II-fold pyridoxal phosphate-dependent enzyme [Streptomyces pinistramenti]